MKTYPIVVDNAENLAASSAVIPDGLLIKEINSAQFKIGNGLHTWNDLTFINKPATIDSIGMVKPDGTSINIDEEGTISSSSSVLATYYNIGTVKPDGKTLKIDNDGNLSVIGLDVSKSKLEENNPIFTEQTTGTLCSEAYTFGTTQSYTAPCTGTYSIYFRKADYANTSGSVILYLNGTQIESFEVNSNRPNYSEEYYLWKTISVNQGDTISVHFWNKDNHFGTYWKIIYSGTKVSEYPLEPSTDFLSIGEMLAVSPVLKPSGNFELDTTEGKYKLNLNIPQNTDCLINGIPDYSNGTNLDITASSILNETTCLQFIPEFDGMASFTITNATASNASSYIGVAVYTKEEMSYTHTIFLSPLRSGDNSYSFIVEKDYVYVIYGNVSASVKGTPKLFPYKAPEYNMPIGIPDFSDGHRLTYTTSGNNHTATMPFDGYVIAMIYHGAANSSMCPTYFRVNDLVVGGVGQATYANGYIVYQSFARKGDTLLFYFEDSKFTQKSITAYSIKPITDNPQLDIYTEDEQIIGKWIDGRFVYRKVWKDILTPQMNNPILLDLPEKFEMEICHKWFGESQVDGILWNEEHSLRGTGGGSTVLICNKNVVSELPEYENKIVLRNYYDDKASGKKSHFILEYVKSGV